MKFSSGDSAPVMQQNGVMESAIAHLDHSVQSLSTDALANVTKLHALITCC